MAKRYYSSVSVWCFIIVVVILKGLNHQGASAELLYTKADAGIPSTDFSRHTLIKPKIYHGREKRQISTTKEEDGFHARDLTIGYVAAGKEYVLELRLNRELVPANFFVSYQHKGKHVVNRPKGKDVELCQYVGEVRGMKDSWAALSTCKGLRGVVYDGKTMHYLQAGDENDLESPHFLYSHDDLVTNHTCGYTGDSSHLMHNISSHHDSHHDHKHDEEGFTLSKNHNEFNRILRYKRSPSYEPEIRGPYNANKMSRYVELVFVVDNKEFRELGKNESEVRRHCKDIANIINSLYAPLNIFIALVGVVIWSERDEIVLSSNGDTTLTNFLHYRRVKLAKDYPNDNAQLLTREQFDGGVVGKALKGPICTFEFSGGVAMDHSNVVGLVATTVAHEMGHNFGMEHDTEECSCPEERCIMSPSSNSQSPTHWSSCSLEYLALAFEHGMDYCLRNKPERLFDSPVCGNGFVEFGEQCDCGMTGSCTGNTCCNPKTCMLYSNATCATGECCNLQTCRPSNAGTKCRSADHECDLPEFCTGQSEFCPENVFKMDTETCDDGKAFCYHGSCRTKSDQCRLLWGPTGKSSDDQCYEMNKKGSRHGNCGYNRLKQNYSKCEGENVFCGMLHCTHLNERLEFGMESVAILSHSFINNNGAIIACRTAIVDLGLNQIDPGLVPDGAKCGDEKMCVNQKCVAVASLRLGPQANPSLGAVCPSDCSGHGVCNSMGHCHCDHGFAPPLCDMPGPGGSLDSGPASDPNAQKLVMKILLIFFLGIVPSILLIVFLVYYSRQNSIMFWKKPKGSPSYVPKQSETASSFSCMSLISCLNGCGKNACSLPSCCSRSEGKYPSDMSEVSLTDPDGDITVAKKKPNIEIKKTGLVSTTNEHVTNNFASYKSRVLSLRNSGIFNREDKRASKIEVRQEYVDHVTSKIKPIPEINVHQAPRKSKLFERNVKGLKVDVKLVDEDHSDCSMSTASTFCPSSEIQEDNNSNGEWMSVKAVREKFSSGKNPFNLRSPSGNGLTNGSGANSHNENSGKSLKSDDKDGTNVAFLNTNDRTPNKLSPRMHTHKKI